MPDPLIKPVLEEIKAVLARHDMAGLVFVSSRTHIEDLYRLDPSWGCIRNEGKGAIRLKAKIGDPLQAEALRLSVGTIAGFADAVRVALANLDQVVVDLGKFMELRHRTTEEPHEEPAKLAASGTLRDFFDAWARRAHGPDYKTKLPPFQLQETERAFVCGFASHFFFSMQVAELSDEEGEKKLRQVQGEIQDYMKLLANVPDDLTSQ